MSQHDLGIIYENEVATVQEFEIENKPYGCHSEYVVKHKTLPCVPKWFNEQDGWDARKKAIAYCDNYDRQMVI